MALKKTKKFDSQSMVDIQNDLVDVFARDTIPLIDKITLKVLSDESHGISVED